MERARVGLLCLVSALLPAQTDWTRLTIPGAPDRIELGLTYDPVRALTFLFGGRGSAGYSNELWSFDGQVWAQVTTGPAPSVRLFPLFVADHLRGELVMFGGNTNPGNDTWTWNGTWTQRFPGTVPPRRYRTAAAYDSLRGLVMMFGGQGAQFWPPLSDFWHWNGTDWQQKTGPGPPARGAGGLAYDAVRDRVVLFGGYPSTNIQLGDTWEWDHAGWSQRATTGPSPRFGAGLIFDSHRQRTVLTGGFLLPLGGDTWEWDGDTWRQITTMSQPANWPHWGIAYDSQRQRVVMHGSGTDTWEYGNRFSGHSVGLGHGCGGVAGVPVLRAQGAAWPQLGATFPIEVVGLAPGTGGVVAMIGFSRTQSTCGALPLELGSFGLAGCTLFVDPEMAFLIGAQGGAALHNIVIPNNPALLGCRLFEQILQPEPGASPPASFSDALEFVIG